MSAITSIVSNFIAIALASDNVEAALVALVARLEAVADALQTPCAAGDAFDFEEWFAAATTENKAWDAAMADVAEAREALRNYRDTKMATFHEVSKCRRCSGQGYIAAYHHVSQGVCFDCFGTGKK